MTIDGARRKANVPVTIFCLFSSVLISLIAMAMVPALTGVAKEVGKGDDGALTAQLIMTIPSIFMIIGASLTGYLSERIGRRAVAILCLVLYSISGASGLLLGSLTALMVSRIILGLVGGALLTIGYVTIGEYFDGVRREWMLGLISAFASFSSVLVLWFGGDFVESFGWRAPFAVYLLGFVMVPFAFLGMHKDLPLAMPKTKQGWVPVLRYWPFFALVAAYTIGMYMPSAQGPFLLAERGETSPALIGKIIAVSSLVSAVGAFFYGAMRKWLNFSGMFTYISAALGIGMITAVMSDTTEQFIIACGIMGLALGVIESTVASEVLARAPEQLHDRAIGLSIAALFFGQFLNPWVAKPFRDAGGADFAFQAIGGCFLIAMVVFAISWVRTRRTQPSS
ncbi:MAG: MFS transporter [Sphingorhabdus sp.]